MFGDLLTLDFGGSNGSDFDWSSLFDFGGGQSDPGSVLPSSGGGGGFDWGSLGSGFMDLGKNVASAALPAAAGVGAGFGLNALMPGKPTEHRLVDPRQEVTRTGGNMALDRATALQQNPVSFGLPGDPNDPSTPAGKKRYDIVQGSRNADAARGMFNTGGSAARETNAVNTQVGNEYNQIWNQSMGTLAGQPTMQTQTSPAQTNPWGQLLGAATAPAVSKGLQSMLADWGMSA